jgi:hypothetical protein
MVVIGGGMVAKGAELEVPEFKNNQYLKAIKLRRRVGRERGKFGAKQMVFMLARMEGDPAR